MATIKAEYYRLNGDTWDLYYFKTTADLVAETADYKVLTAGERTKITDYLTTFNAANKLLRLDASAKIPAAQIPSLSYLPIGGGSLTGSDRTIKSLNGIFGGTANSNSVLFDGNKVKITSNQQDMFTVESDGQTGTILAHNNIISQVSDPVNGKDVANRQWVEQLVAQGTHVVGAVRASSTGNVTPLSGTKTVDGIALVAEDRVLLKDQTTASQNGVYIVNSGAWTKVANDSDKGSLTFVLEGSTNKGKQFYNKNGTTWETFFIQDTYYAVTNGGLELDSSGFGFKIKTKGVADAMINSISYSKVGKLPEIPNSSLFPPDNTAWPTIKTTMEGNEYIVDHLHSLYSAIRLIRGETDIGNAAFDKAYSIKGLRESINAKNITAAGAALPSGNDMYYYNTGDIYLRTLS